MSQSSLSEPCPTCATGGSSENGGAAGYIFAIGSIKARLPSPAIEKEFAQVLSEEQIGGMTDQAVFFNALKEHRHLANEVCWSFSIESTDAYILMPRDTLMLDQLIEAVKPAPRGTDVDVIIGTRGPIAPYGLCNGLAVPMVIVDKIYSFDRQALIQALPKPAAADMSEEAFRSSAEELFDRVLQLADNAGATDEHRAVNYLAVRYPAFYAHTSEMSAQNHSLTNVSVINSRLTGTRKLVNVILTYTNRATDVAQKFYVRVDVTEKYPFLEKKLSPYYDRD